MSQQKVDRYKEEKANRKKNIKKQKVRGAFSRIIIALVALAIVVYLGFSVYRHFNPVETTTEHVNRYSVEELSSILESENATDSNSGIQMETETSIVNEEELSSMLEEDETANSSDDSSDATEESGEDTTSSDEE